MVMTEDNKLKLEILQANLKNTEREIASISSAASETSLKIELIKEQLDCRMKINDIAQANFVCVQPKWAWETDPEYLRVNRILSDNEFKFKSFELINILKQLEKALASYKEQVDSQEEAKKSIIAEIEEVSV